MTPAARLAAAAAILDTLDRTRPVEPQLKAWARGNRYAGSKDRRAIADRVYTVLRCWRSTAIRGGGETGRARVLGSLAHEGVPLPEIEALCSGGYGLSALSETERANLAHGPDWPGEGSRLDWPDWLMEGARAVFGESLETELNALRQRAPVDLRVNTLKGARADAMAALRGDGLDAVLIPAAPLGLRLPPAAPVLNTTAWREGLVELQDAGSQAVAALLAAQPGERVLDFCAGGGGKTLALAAMMENRGHLLAHDIDRPRMADLPQRAARAGVTCIAYPRDISALDGQCDRVLVDAPCSGSGSWRRDPVGKWRLTPKALTALTALQDDALDTAARTLRPGGVLVYATCSVLRAENEDRVSAFLARHRGFTAEKSLRLHPARDICDGFFAAQLHLTVH